MRHKPRLFSFVPALHLLSSLTFYVQQICDITSIAACQEISQLATFLLTSKREMSKLCCSIARACEAWKLENDSSDERRRYNWASWEGIKSRMMSNLFFFNSWCYYIKSSKHKWNKRRISFHGDTDGKCFVYIQLTKVIFKKNKLWIVVTQNYGIASKYRGQTFKGCVKKKSVCVSGSYEHPWGNPTEVQLYGKNGKHEMNWKEIKLQRHLLL